MSNENAFNILLQKFNNSLIKEWDLELPSGWQNLVDIAKFSRGKYLDRILESQIPGQSLTDRTDSGSWMVSRAYGVESTTPLYALAKDLYFGARVAVIENRKGDFSNADEIFSREQEAANTGAIVSFFASSRVQGLIELAESIGLERVAELFTPGPVTEFRELANHVTTVPKTEVILALVKKDLGILPERTMRAIATIMKDELVP